MQDLSALNGKTLSELREIAKVLGITDQSLKKRELIARIAEMAAAENDTEENAETAAAVEGDAEPQRKRGRRPRMSSVRIEENKPAGEASSERVRIVVPESAGAAASEESAAEPSPAAEVPAEQEAPKRRGRKPKAVKEAEQFAAEDKKHKDEVDTHNAADQVIYQTEKTLNELGDKVSESEKAPVQAALEDLKTKNKGNDIEAIKAATDAVQKAFYASSEKLYQQAAPQQGEANNGGAANNGGHDDGVVDADYEEVKD